MFDSLKQCCNLNLEVVSDCRSVAGPCSAMQLVVNASTSSVAERSVDFCAFGVFESLSLAAVAERLVKLLTRGCSF